jgi:transposase
MEILRKSVKHTKLFQITQDEIESILRNNYVRTKDIEKNSKLVMESFQNTTVPEYFKEALIVQIRFILDQHDLLKRQLLMLEKRIKRAVDEIGPKSMTIPGVGPVTCAVVLGTYGDMNRFRDKRAVTAYAGLDPRIIQSGKSINRTGRISKTGNKYVRRYLLNAAFVGCLRNPVIKQKYHHLKSKGKPHLVALTACARKLLLMMYSVEKNQKRFYVPEYISEQ